MSRMTICAASVLWIPTMRSRVDCGLGLVMLSFCPTMRLRSVDLPAFGLPTTVTIPALLIGGKLSGTGARDNGDEWRMNGCKKTNGPSECSDGPFCKGAGDGLLSRGLSTGVPSAL